MNAKRRRDGSLVGTQAGVHGNGSPISEVANSTPILRSQVLPHPQQPLRKRVSSLPRNGSFDTTASSLPRHAGPRSPHLGYTFPSEADEEPEGDDDINEREEADLLNEVVMAIDMRDRGTIGCCYYVAREERLALLSDVQYGGLEVIDACRSPRPEVKF